MANFSTSAVVSNAKGIHNLELIHSLYFLFLSESDNGPQSNVPTANHLVVALLRMLGDLLKRSTPPAPTAGSETDSSKLASSSTSTEEQVENMDTGDAQGRQTDEQVRATYSREESLRVFSV